MQELMAEIRTLIEFGLMTKRQGDKVIAELEDKR